MSYVVVYLSVTGPAVLQLLIWVTSHAIEAELSEDGECLCWGVGFRETVFFFMVRINSLMNGINHMNLGTSRK